jgi:hypothetical protein
MVRSAFLEFLNLDRWTGKDNVLASGMMKSLEIFNLE